MVQRQAQPLAPHDARVLRMSHHRAKGKKESAEDALQGKKMYLKARSVRTPYESLEQKCCHKIAWKEMGEPGVGKRSKKVVFVTVGTTCFDSLVKAVDSQPVREELLKKGYTDLLIQIGRGSYIPLKSLGEDGSLAVDYFTFSPSIGDYLRAASLIISHAGSGSIFETLALGKPLVVVVNEDLMDNHQSELAEELAERKHIFCAHPHMLQYTISGMDLDSLVAYTPGDSVPVAKLINKFLGFSAD